MVAHRRGKGVDVATFGLLCGWCGCGFMAWMFERLGEILTDLCGVGKVLG